MTPIKVVMVTGSYSSEACGVGNYTATLVEKLKELGIDVQVYRRGPWGLFQAFRIAKEIRALKPDVIHIQYPTVGFNRSLGPQLLCLLLSSVVTTIHESSQVHWLRRISLFPFLLNSRQLIFTNDFELQFTRQFVPWIGERASVIPVGSSISTDSSDADAQESRIAPHRDLNDIVCFGLIRPQKGIEDFIEAARLSKKQNSEFRFTLVGMVDPRFSAYFDDLKSKTKDLSFTWELGLSDSAVAQRLSKAAFAYMPYPDGVTERRTSMLSLLSRGVVVLTTESKMTSHFFKQNLQIASSPEEAFKRMVELRGSAQLLKTAVDKGFVVAKTFDWPSITKKHLDVYLKLVTTGLS